MGPSVINDFKPCLSVIESLIVKLHDVIVNFPPCHGLRHGSRSKHAPKTLCLHALPRYTIIVIFLRNYSCHNWVELLFTFNCWKYIKYRHGQPTNLIYSKYVTYNNLMQLPPVLFKTVLFFVLCLVWGSCDSTKAIS